jgi:hypothetical protein
VSFVLDTDICSAYLKGNSRVATRAEITSRFCWPSPYPLPEGEGTAEEVISARVATEPVDKFLGTAAPRPDAKEPKGEEGNDDRRR